MLPMIYMAIVDDDDIPAFEKLYNKYKHKAYLVAMDFLNNTVLAEDCVSEAFIAIARNFQIVNKLEPNKQLKYVVICIKNTAKDILKKEKINLNTEEYDDESYFTDSSYSEYSLVDWKECLKRLNQTDMDILYLRCVLRLEYKEICQMLGISHSAARGRVFAAKANLRKLLGKEDS